MNNFANRLKGIPHEMQSHALDLPEHLTESGYVNKLSHLLTDLHFIEAKCAAGMTYDLIADYEAALDALPEYQEEKQKELEHEQRIKKYTEDMINYARKWSDARERHAIDPENNPMPNPEDIPLPEIIPSVEPWSGEKIREDSEKITNNPTRLDRIRAFSQFVKSESHALVKFASHPGFCVQQAYNYANSGPVARVAREALNYVDNKALILIRTSASQPPYNPYPARLFTLEGHTASVHCVSVTLDGKHAISGSFDATLRLWNIKTGQCLQTFEGHSDRVSAVSMTPDGRLAVSGSFDKTLRVWNLETSRCLHTLEGHTDTVRCVSVTPDGKHAISGSDDESLQVWNLDSGKCLRTLLGHKERVSCVDMTPDGKLAISGSRDYYGEKGDLRVWNLESGECLRRLMEHKSVDSVNITPDGKRAVSGSHDKTIRIWDLDKGVCLRTLLTPDGVARVCVTSDGMCAVSVGLSTFIMVWDLKRGDCINKIEAHTRTTGGMKISIESLSMTPDGRQAVTGGWDGTLMGWNLDSRESHKRFNVHKHEVENVKIILNIKRALSTAKYEDSICIWDIESGKCLGSIKKLSSDVYCSVTPDGMKTVLTNTNPPIRNTQFVSSIIKTLDHKRSLINKIKGWFDKDFFPKNLVDNLQCYDLRREDYFRTFDMDKTRVISPDGKRVIFGGKYDNINVWDIETEKCIRIYESQTKPNDLWEEFGLEMTPDGKRIITLHRDAIRMLDLKSGNWIKIFGSQTNHLLGIDTFSPSSLRITPDGKRAVTVNDHSTIRIWDLRSGECIRTLEGPPRFLDDLYVNIDCLNVTLDGRRVVTAGNDKILRLWDLEDGECLSILQIRDNITSISEMTAGGKIGIGTVEGEVIFSSLFNSPIMPPVVTPVRIWLYNKEEGRDMWDKGVTLLCYWCSIRFPVPDKILNVIKRINSDTGLSPDQSPCLELPDEAWDDPQLLSECPHCHKPLKFNPFVVDNQGRW